MNNKEDDRVLKLSRFHAKKLLNSLSKHKRKRVDFDELVSAGYIAGIHHKDKQSLWRWIRNGQIDVLKSLYPSYYPSAELTVPNGSITTVNNEVLVDTILDIHAALMNAMLTNKEIDILQYRFWDCLSFTDIAKIYNVTRQTITESYYKPAIKKLSLYLKER